MVQLLFPRIIRSFFLSSPTDTKSRPTIGKGRTKSLSRPPTISNMPNTEQWQNSVTLGAFFVSMNYFALDDWNPEASKRRKES